MVCVYQGTENKVKNKMEFILPPNQVIQSVIKYIKASGSGMNKPKDALVNMQRWGKQNASLNVNQALSETLLNSFVYMYLLHHLSMFDPLFERRSEDKII